MTTTTRHWKILLAAGLLCAGRAIADSPAMQSTAEEFTQKLNAPSALQVNRKPKLRGVGTISSDSSTPPENDAATSNDYLAIAGQSYPDLTRAQPKAQSSIQFDYDSTRIQVASHGILNELAKALQSTLANAVLIVAGHTDSEGAAGYNQRLSQGRAQAVKDYLVSLGVNPARLIVRGFGEDYPIDNNDTESGRASNRRSEFIRVGNM